MEEEKEKAELEIKQRLDDIGAGEEDDREGAGEESNKKATIEKVPASILLTTTRHLLT
jgi:hypothetical protein